LKSQPSTRETPADAPKTDALADIFAGKAPAKKTTGAKSKTKDKTPAQIVAEAEARAKKRVAAAKKKAQKAPEPVEAPEPEPVEVAEEPKPPKKATKTPKKTPPLSDEDKEMLAVMRDMDDNSDERWELEIKVAKDPAKLREMGGKIDSGRYGSDKAPLLRLLKARMAELKGS